MSIQIYLMMLLVLLCFGIELSLLFKCLYLKQRCQTIFLHSPQLCQKMSIPYIKNIPKIKRVMPQEVHKSDGQHISWAISIEYSDHLSCF